jgi:hypothetical protein
MRHNRSKITMMKNSLVNLMFIFIFYNTMAQPELNSWLLNISSETGYNNQPSNVQSIHYTNIDLYVSCSCIPGYDIGPWAGNPNQAENQNFCFKITRSPQEAINKQPTGMGHIGVWSNGVSVFNAKDAFSYNNQGIWNQDAFVFEGSSFDECLGHPAPNGEYHNHINPTCLYDDLDDQNHSPIIGYAFDGFPIYGSYAYENTDGTGEIKRMETSYKIRDISERNSLPDGSILSPNEYGPDVSYQDPLGNYLEDYEYVDGYGHLNEFNGRFCVTPEYLEGTFAYFVTISEQGLPQYPYVLGPSYYGVIQSGNTGPQSGHNSIPNSANSYNLDIDIAEIDFNLFPIPTNELIYLTSQYDGIISVFNLLGDVLDVKIHRSPVTLISLEYYSPGIYVVQFNSNKITHTKKIQKI